MVVTFPFKSFPSVSFDSPESTQAVMDLSLHSTESTPYKSTPVRYLSPSNGVHGLEEEDAKESKRFFDTMSAIRTKLIKEHEAKRERALVVEEVEANKKKRRYIPIGCIMSEIAVLDSSIANKARNQQVEVMNEEVVVMRMQGRKKFVLRTTPA